MAAASQAVPGEFDSRRLLQKDKRTQRGAFFFLEKMSDYQRDNRCVSTEQKFFRYTVCERVGKCDFYAIIKRTINKNLSMKINEPLEYVRRLYYLCFSK